MSNSQFLRFCLGLVCGFLRTISVLAPRPKASKAAPRHQPPPTFAQNKIGIGIKGTTRNTHKNLGDLLNTRHDPGPILVLQPPSRCLCLSRMFLCFSPPKVLEGPGGPPWDSIGDRDPLCDPCRPWDPLPSLEDPLEGLGRTVRCERYVRYALHHTHRTVCTVCTVCTARMVCTICIVCTVSTVRAVWDVYLLYLLRTVCTV